MYVNNISELKVEHIQQTSKKEDEEQYLRNILVEY